MVVTRAKASVSAIVLGTLLPLPDMSSVAQHGQKSKDHWLN